jgi:serine/threonine-protein kinase RsbW
VAVQELRLELEPTPSTVPVARAAFRAHFADHLADEALETATLLLSELVTNSVLHARLTPTQPVVMRAEFRNARLRAEVCDEGRSFDEQALAEPTQGRAGWGLHLVERMADRWGVSRSGVTCVWFELELAEAPARTSPRSGRGLVG